MCKFEETIRYETRIESVARICHIRSSEPTAMDYRDSSPSIRGKHWKPLPQDHHAPLIFIFIESYLIYYRQHLFRITIAAGPHRSTNHRPTETFQMECFGGFTI